MQKVLHTHDTALARFIFIERPKEISSFKDLHDMFCVMRDEQNRNRYFYIQVVPFNENCQALTREVAADRILDYLLRCFKTKEFIKKFGTCELLVRDFDTIDKVTKRLKRHLLNIVTSARFPTVIRSFQPEGSRRRDEKYMAVVEVRIRRGVVVRCYPSHIKRDNPNTDSMVWGEATIFGVRNKVYVFIPSIVAKSRLLTLELLQQEFDRELQYSFPFITETIPIVFSNDALQFLMKDSNNASEEESVTE